MNGKRKTILYVTFLSMAPVMLLLFELSSGSPEVCLWKRMDSRLVRGGAGACYATRSSFQALCNMDESPCNTSKCSDASGEYRCTDTEHFIKNAEGWNYNCATPETGKQNCPSTEIHCAIKQTCHEDNCIKPPGQEDHYCQSFTSTKYGPHDDHRARGTSACP